MKGKREDGEEEVVEEAGGGFEGMEALTRAIETGKQRREGGRREFTCICMMSRSHVYSAVACSNLSHGHHY